MPDAEAAFGNHVVIVRMNQIQPILSGFCTWYLLYSVYAVHCVCCTQCMLYSGYAVLGVC